MLHNHGSSLVPAVSSVAHLQKSEVQTEYPSPATGGWIACTVYRGCKRLHLLSVLQPLALQEGSDDFSLEFKL